MFLNEKYLFVLKFQIFNNYNLEWCCYQPSHPKYHRYYANYRLFYIFKKSSRDEFRNLCLILQYTLVDVHLLKRLRKSLKVATFSSQEICAGFVSFQLIFKLFNLSWVIQIEVSSTEYENPKKSRNTI